MRDRTPQLSPRQQARRGKASEYGRQLREKQKVRRIYGLQESQFRAYFGEADRKKGVTGDLLQLLECRLDNIVYRMGFASAAMRPASWSATRHFLVNGKRSTSPPTRPRRGMW